MQVVSSREQARAAVSGRGTVGLVPTMGFLHDGHLSLVRAAARDNDVVAVSIFVNPRQFGAGEDLDSYPRDLERDLAILEDAGVDVAWVPEVHDIYPRGFSARIELEGTAERLEGARRHGHFSGVATVVSILLGVIRPDRSYFGQKDAQQAIVIRQLVRDLALPGEVVVRPTVREADGLAMSSRNAYLDEEQRAAAPAIHRALANAERAWRDGEADAHALRAAVWAELVSQARGQVEYVSVGDPETLQELDMVRRDRGGLLSTVVRYGNTRLLDNVVLQPAGAEGAIPGEVPADSAGGHAPH